VLPVSSVSSPPEGTLPPRIDPLPPAGSFTAATIDRHTLVGAALIAVTAIFIVIVTVAATTALAGIVLVPVDRIVLVTVLPLWVPVQWVDLRPFGFPCRRSCSGWTRHA